MFNRKFQTSKKSLWLYGLLLAVWWWPFSSTAQEAGGRHQPISNYFPPLHNTKDIKELLNTNRQLQFTGTDSALQFYRYILRESRKLQYAFGACAALIGMGNVYTNQSLSAEALQAAMEAVSYARKDTASRRLLALAYNNAGRAAKDLGDYKEATNLLFKAAETIEKVPDSRLALELVYNNLGSIMQDDSLSLYYFDKSEAISRKKQDLSGVGLALINKSYSYDNMKAWSRSEACLQEALQIGVQISDTLLQRRALVKLGINAIIRNMPQKGLAYLDEAEKAGRDINVFFNNALGFSRAEAYLQMKDYKKAEAYCKKALAVAIAYNIREHVYEGHRILAAVYGQSGQHKKAYEEQLRFQQLKDSIMNEDVERNKQQLQTRYEVAQKDKSLAQKQLQITQQQRRLGQNRILILATMVGAVLLAILFFFVYRNYSNKQRLLLKDQELSQLKAMIKGEEKERGRIARELHDGIGGMLVAINMNLGIIKRDHPETGLDRIEGMLDDAGREVRKTAHNLVPDVLEKHDLLDALALYCAKINDAGILQIQLQCDETLPQTDAVTALILYRIIQELVQNIVKHAGATQAGIHILQYEDKLAITIEDNGKGFDPAAAQGGIGLNNVRHRVNALQGEVNISASPGRGTTIHIELLRENLTAALK